MAIIENFPFKERYEEYRRRARKLDTSEVLYFSRLLDSLEEVSIKDGYSIRTYNYAEKFIPESNRGSSFYFRNIPYVYKTNASEAYTPIMERTFFQKLFNTYPRTIKYKNTEFTEDMLIFDPVFTPEVASCIPSPIPYFSASANMQGIWQLIFYAKCLSKDFYYIVFSEEDLPVPYKEGDPRPNVRFMDSEAYYKIVEGGASPKIEINNEEIHVKYIKLHDFVCQMDYTLKENPADHRFYIESYKETVLGTHYKLPDIMTGPIDPKLKELADMARDLLMQQDDRLDRFVEYKS